MKNVIIMIAIAAVAGCQTNRSPSLVVLPEGYQVVAEGRPPIGFFMGEKGQLIVTDVTARSTVYSMDSKDEGPGALIKVESDQLIAQVPNQTGTRSESVTLLSGLDAEHQYRIVFRPASATTRPGPAATTAPRR